jgi:adenine C2-methylase RlmN of 23S rRNA A2503 and tRNA A37
MHNPRHKQRQKIIRLKKTTRMKRKYGTNISVDLPTNKKNEVALTYIYGKGITTSKRFFLSQK